MEALLVIEIDNGTTESGAKLMPQGQSGPRSSWGVATESATAKISKILSVTFQ